MESELMTILEQIERDKGIAKEVLIEAVEAAVASAAPAGPRSRQAQKMASWVEAGPGSRLVAATPSSNSPSPISSTKNILPNQKASSPRIAPHS